MPRWLWLVVALSVIVGIAFRVEHVERRQLWQDEAATAQRISGHVDPEFRSIFDGKVHPVSDILRFQRFDPRRGVGYTIHGLAVEEPHHPPLFYILDHYWAGAFGSSIPSMRALALIFGVLALAGVYWFCIELTSSPVAGGVAVALMALSPFFVNYAGQAREYTLWALMICVTSALLLRVLRKQSAPGWVLYGAAMTIALYSDLLMVCVLAAHALYVAVRYRKDRAALVGFAISGGAAALLFSPWIAIDIERGRRIAVEMAWGFYPYPPRLWLEKWIFNAGTVLFDAEYARMLLAPLAGIGLLALLYGAWRTMRDEPANTKWMLGTLGAVIAAQQILTDIAMHGHESTTARYELPLWLALLLGLAIFLGRRLSQPNSARYGMWVSAFCAVLLLAGASSAINSQAVAWWDNNDNTPSSEIAEQINASGPAPLVVSEGYWAEVLVMSHYVRPDTNFLLFKRYPPFPLHVTHNTFLLVPSKTTLDAFEREPQYELIPVPIEPMTSNALLSFHDTLEKTEREKNHPISWRTHFLYRLESRVASR